MSRAAIEHRDDHVLCDVSKFTSQVTGVSRLQSRIRETLPGTVSRAEVFKNRQSFTEVGLDRSLNNLTVRLRHQAPHTGQLGDLTHTAPGTGVGHQIDRVEIDFAVANVRLQLFHHLIGDQFPGMRPGVDDVVVTFAVCNQTTLIVPVEARNPFLCISQDLVFRFWSTQVIGRKRQA